MRMTISWVRARHGFVHDFTLQAAYGTRRRESRLHLWHIFNNAGTRQTDSLEYVDTRYDRILPETGSCGPVFL